MEKNRNEHGKKHKQCLNIALYIPLKGRYKALKSPIKPALFFSKAQKAAAVAAAAAKGWNYQAFSSWNGRGRIDFVFENLTFHENQKIYDTLKFYENSESYENPQKCENRAFDETRKFYKKNKISRTSRIPRKSDILRKSAI